VLVDNKSVAEIGERHLVCLGSERFGERARVRPVRARRPITVTGGRPGAYSKGASPVWSSTIQFMIRRRPGRKAGIDPIEDVLGGEIVGFNRLAVERLWLARHAGRSEECVAAQLRGGSLGSASRERQRASDAEWTGKAPPAQRRRELAGSESAHRNQPTTQKLSRRKTASFSPSTAGANRRHGEKTDGVR